MIGAKAFGHLMKREDSEDKLDANLKIKDEKIKRKNLLKAEIKRNDPSFCYKILRKGSSGLAESYMQGEFETEDLTSLIELNAKNINIIHKVLLLPYKHF